MLSALFKLLAIRHNVMNNRVVEYLFKKRQVNVHLVDYTEGNQLQKQYIQYLPDRYSDNLPAYKNEVGFFDYADIEKWAAGFYQNNAGDITRFFALNLCIDQLIDENIVGDVAELGVFKGNSAFLLAKLARRTNKTCYLFDTFEGFDKRDLQQPGEKQYDQDFSGTHLNTVEAFVGKQNTVYVKGFFPDSLTQIDDLAQLALVHIDCDLGEPFKAALNYFYPRLQKGGFLLMHDYSSLYWPAAKQAVDDFFKDKPEFIIPIPDKSGTCIIRKI